MFPELLNMELNLFLNNLLVHLFEKRLAFPKLVMCDIAGGSFVSQNAGVQYQKVFMERLLLNWLPIRRLEKVKRIG